MGDDELARIARHLLALSAERDSAGASSPIAILHPADLAQLAQKIYLARRLREDLFGERLFSEPAWDIILHLYVQDYRGVKETVTSVCRSSCVPEATALRQVERLEDLGLLRRTSDSGDRRRRLVALTDEGRFKMTEFLQRTARSMLSLLPMAAI